MGNRERRNGTHQKNLHLPVDLHDQIAALAKRNGQSIAAEIRAAIQEHVARSAA